MNTQSVLLTTPHEIVDFVNKIEKMPFRADLRCDGGVMDAKSLLGVMGFGLGKVMTLCIYCDEAVSLSGIEQYIVK